MSLRHIVICLNSQAEAERLLDEGKLFVRIAHGQWWRVRRNGRTQTWKTRPDHFRVPVKAGLRVYGEINHANLHSGNWAIRGE